MYKKIIAFMSVFAVVFLCSIEFNNVYAAVSPYIYSKNGTTVDYSDEDNNHAGQLTVNVVSYTGELNGSDTVYTQVDPSVNFTQYGYYSMHNIFTCKLTNITNEYAIADLNAFSIDVYTGINGYFDQFQLFGHVENISGNIAPRFILSTKVQGRDTMTVYWENPDTLVLNPNETKVFYFDLVLDFMYNGSLPLGYQPTNMSLIRNASSSITWTRKPETFSYVPVETFVENDNFPNNVIAYLDGILKRITQYTQQYNSNSQNASDVTNGSNSLENTSNQQHTQELSYYSQTNTALGNTGISNYSFNQEQIGGIGGVSEDFTRVFNSLGSWNSVYIFSLTLGLALMIIRHVRPIRRSKS